jgi:hypothetical protein
MMRLALATCTNLPGWEKDDIPFQEAITRLGGTYECVAWDNPDAQWDAYDACVIRTTWDYMERQSDFVAWARSVGKQTRLFNDPRVIDWNTDKQYLRDLSNVGIPIAPSVWMEKGSIVDLNAILAAKGWDKAFLKPQVGASARETLRFTRLEVPEAQAFLQRVLARENMILQPYIKSVETDGEISAIFFDETLSHCVQKVPVPGDYRVQDDFGAKDFPITPPPTVVEIAQAALVGARSLLEVSEPLLYARADFLKMESGDYVLNELELVEPSLFFRHSETAGTELASLIQRRLREAR